MCMYHKAEWPNNPPSHTLEETVSTQIDAIMDHLYNLEERGNLDKEDAAMITTIEQLIEINQDRHAEIEEQEDKTSTPFSRMWG